MRSARENRTPAAGTTIAIDEDVRAGCSSSDQGFTLVDALIASLILSVAIASLAQLIVVGQSAVALAGRAMATTLLAANKVEELRADASLVPGAYEDVPRPGFSREWSIVDAPSDPSHLAVIHVAVRTAGFETRLTALGVRRVP